MIPDNISPAVKMSDIVPNEMSAEEFQKRLYSWFEDRGLLSELRAHLRKQMIGALKETSIGLTIAQHKQSVSPKTQALNLLVGEFLLHYNYHYSLSVFSTEVPLTNVLPEVPIPLKSSQDKGACQEWKFAEKDMWDILETVGVARESEIGEKIHSAYYKNDQQPLLACLIKFPNQILGSVNANIEALLASNSYEEWVKAVAEILHSNQINAQQIKNVLNSIVTIVDNEKKGIQQECSNLQAKLQQYEKLRQEQTKFDRTQKQLEVEDYQVKLLHHQNMLQERYHQLIIKEREVQMREHRLNERERQLEFREEQLHKKLDEIKHGTTNEHNGLVVQLQSENKTLQTIKEEQCRKIEELTERSTILMRDLESTQAAVNILTNNKSMPLLSPLHSNKPSLVVKKSRLSQSSSSSEECTCSSNILQEARERLKRLEEESEKVDRHYRQFKLQRSQEGLLSYGINRCGSSLLNRKSAFVTPRNPDLEKDKDHRGLQQMENPCKDTDSISNALDNSLSISISSDDKTN